MNMKKKIALLLAALLVLTGAVAVVADDPVRNADTTATIKFIDGDVEFDEFDTMKIDFGEHPLPVKEITYNYEEPVTLGIIDARQSAGNWNVTVYRTGEFTDGTNTFEGELILGKRTVTHSQDETETIINESITVGAGVVNASIVINVAEEQTTGIFYVKWEEEDAITLTILEDDLGSLDTESEFVETLYWTLEVFEDDEGADG